MSPRALRILPAVVVVLLLFAAALASRSSRAAGSGSPVIQTTHCSPSVQSGGTESTYVIHAPSRYVQPIAADVVPLGQLTLDVTEDYPFGTTGTLKVVEWDPVLLVPDPTTVALRSRDYQASQVFTSGLQIALDPPLVSRSIGGVAEPPRPTVAIDYQMTVKWYPWEPQYLFWSPDGPPETPLAYDFTSGSAQALPGPHAVLGHALCPGPSASGAYVCQSVMRCDTVPPANGVNAIVQRFRVPQRTVVGWVELAFGTFGATPAVGTVAILDAQGSTMPPIDASGSLMRANLRNIVPGTWGTHFGFDQAAALEPGHDYWLWVTTGNYYSVYLRRLTGGEPALFTAGIGELWQRAGIGGGWLAADAHALAFRLIGTPEVVVGVGPGGVARSPLQLTAAPNPAGSATTIRWAGARGAVEFDVFDPTGRHVASGSADGAEGAWTWRSARGTRSAGVYFVRAMDAAGNTASLRVTMVR